MNRAYCLTVLSSWLCFGVGCERVPGGSEEREILTIANLPESHSSSSHPTNHHYFHHSPQARDAEWGYEGDRGPEHWATLSPNYSLASLGTQQSPINITSVVGQSLPPLKFHYRMAEASLVNNGHTIQDTEPEGSRLHVGGKTFELKQFHFHAPSEHTIDGQQMPMEMHLVHKTTDGHVAVVGVMIVEGTHNENFAPIWDYLPTERNTEQRSPVRFNAMDLLPEDHSYYHYLGSFTTPPCTEGVLWFVLCEPIELSVEQIEQFKAIIDHNNRPVQPLNGRVVQVSQ